jgi:hypothetical protein
VLLELFFMCRDEIRYPFALMCDGDGCSRVLRCSIEDVFRRHQSSQGSISNLTRCNKARRVSQKNETIESSDALISHHQMDKNVCIVAESSIGSFLIRVLWRCNKVRMTPVSDVSSSIQVRRSTYV